MHAWLDVLLICSKACWSVQANARAKEKTGQLQQARQCYRRAIVTDPQYALAYQVSRPPAPVGILPVL